VNNTLELFNNSLLYRQESESINPNGDGKTSKRIVEALVDKLQIGVRD